jgi:hypothetical protein
LVGFIHPTIGQILDGPVDRFQPVIAGGLALPWCRPWLEGRWILAAGREEIRVLAIELLDRLAGAQDSAVPGRGRRLRPGLCGFRLRRKGAL